MGEDTGLGNVLARVASLGVLTTVSRVFHESKWQRIFWEVPSVTGETPFGFTYEPKAVTQYLESRVPQYPPAFLLCIQPEDALDYLLQGSREKDPQRRRICAHVGRVIARITLASESISLGHLLNAGFADELQGPEVDHLLDPLDIRNAHPLTLSEADDWLYGALHMRHLALHREGITEPRCTDWFNTAVYPAATACVLALEVLARSAIYSGKRGCVVIALATHELTLKRLSAARAVVKGFKKHGAKKVPDGPLGKAIELLVTDPRVLKKKEKDRHARWARMLGEKNEAIGRMLTGKELSRAGIEHRQDETPPPEILETWRKSGGRYGKPAWSEHNSQ